VKPIFRQHWFCGNLLSRNDVFAIVAAIGPIELPEMKLERLLKSLSKFM